MVIWSPSAFPVRFGSLDAGVPDEVGVTWLDADADGVCVGVLELVGRPDVEQPARAAASATANAAKAAKRPLIAMRLPSRVGGGV